MSIECTTIYFVGLDVHKESVTAAVFRGREAEPMRVDRLNNDDRSLRATSSDWPRPASRGRAYEASGAVARELIGFVWAVLHDFDITQLQHSEVSRAA